MTFSTPFPGGGPAGPSAFEIVNEDRVARGLPPFTSVEEWQDDLRGPWGEDITDLGNRLTALETIEITGLSSDPNGAQELGTSVTPVLSWGYIGAAVPVKLRIEGDAEPDPTITEWTALSPITATTTYTVEVEDVLGRTDSADVTVQFLTRSFWGASPNASLTSAQIIALANSALTSARARDVTINASGGQYVYYCWPTSLGTVAGVKAYGFPLNPDGYSVTTVSVTTVAGYTTDYYVLRLTNQLDDSAVDLEIS
ncbi:hypothetical protein LA6_003443 [Marinibacterium anthonyi]|nr:hypothetical protein LA6_003443 [Marinibacterium anthonyi]